MENKKRRSRSDKSKKKSVKKSSTKKQTKKSSTKKQTKKSSTKKQTKKSSTKKQTKKSSTKKQTKQKGGRTGTSGSFDVLVGDIKSLVVSIVDTIINTTELVIDVFEFPSEITGKIPYKQPDAPGSELA